MKYSRPIFYFRLLNICNRGFSNFNEEAPQSWHYLVVLATNHVRMLKRSVEKLKEHVFNTVSRERCFDFLIFRRF